MRMRIKYVVHDLIADSLVAIHIEMCTLCTIINR